MFKKVFGATILLMLSASVFSAEPYKEGVHYTVVSTTLAQKENPHELREYFSLLCPHCYELERHMPAIKSGLPARMAFKRTHVDFLGGVPQPVQTSLTQGLVLATKYGKEQAFVDAAFKGIHQGRIRPTQTKDVFQPLLASGVLQSQIEQELNSDEVIAVRKAMQADQNFMVEQGIIKGVPALLVNGRYVLHLHEMDPKDPISDLTKLIKYLDDLPVRSQVSHE